MTLAGLLAVFAVIGALLVVLVVQQRSARLRRVGKGLLVSYAVILLVLAVGEAYFRFFHADSEGRKASDNWSALYWHTNAEGFRDREWTPADWAGKTTVAVVGDSLAAGWSIDDPADRFSDVLAARLGDGYAVFNLGALGASTPRALGVLRDAPDPTPDVVILQYYLNDIEYAALTQGFSIPQQNPPRLAQESYLADYLYARASAGFNQDYWSIEYGFYDHAAIWATHEREINAFIDYVEEIGAQLIVVIFPNMLDPVGSIAYVDRVAQAFEAHGQREIIKLYDAVAAQAPNDAIASRRDGHPSVSFHHLVGNMLYEQFFAPNRNP